MSQSDDALTKVLPIALGKPKEKRGGFDDLALTYAYNTTEAYKHNVEEDLESVEKQLADIAVNKACRPIVTLQYRLTFADRDAILFVAKRQQFAKPPYPGKIQWPAPTGPAFFEPLERIGHL